MELDDELPTAEAWMVNAACKDYENPDLFFTGTPEAINEAISICHQCPVRILCAEYAINNEVADGVWGGLTENDRKSIRRQKVSRKGIRNKQH